jgi:hypothetical protein
MRVGVRSIGGMGSLGRRAAGALLIPVLLVAASFTHDRMRCRLTGAVVPVCACPEGEVVDAPQSTLEAQSCCERESVAPFTAVRAEGPTVAIEGAPFLIESGFEAPVYRAPGRAWSRAVARGMPPNAAGAALILLKQSFLI